LKLFLYDEIEVIFYMGAVGAKFTWRGPLFNYISRILNNLIELFVMIIGELEVVLKQEGDPMSPYLFVLYVEKNMRERS